MRTCVTLGMLLALTGSAIAQFNWLDAMPLNTTASTDDDGPKPFGDYYPTLANDDAGNWVAVWCAGYASGGSTLRDFEIYIARSSGDVMTWSAPELLDSFASDPAETEDDFHPQVFTDGAGNWLTSWYTHDTHGGTIGDDTDLLVSHSSDLGVTWTSSIPLNADAATDQIPTDFSSDSYPTIAVDPNGLWVAIWSRTLESGTEGDLYIAQSTDNGASWSMPQIFMPYMNTDDADDYSPVLVNNQAGGWMVVWISSETLGDTIGSDNDLFFSTSSDGYNWSAPAVVNNDAATDGDMNDKTPDLGYDDSGRWLVVWYEGIYDVVEDDIVFAYSDDFGATWSDPGNITLNDAENGGPDLRPTIATDGTGRWVATWYGENTYGLPPIGADYDLFYSVSEDFGETWSYPSLLNSYGIQLVDFTGDWYPEISATSAGRWVVAWQSIYDPTMMTSDRDIMYTTACMPTTLGDVHCDGAVDMRDVKDMQLNFTANATDPSFAPYDIDNDDAITFADVDLQLTNLTGPN